MKGFYKCIEVPTIFISHLIFLIYKSRVPSLMFKYILMLTVLLPLGFTHNCLPAFWIAEPGLLRTTHRLLRAATPRWTEGSRSLGQFSHLTFTNQSSSPGFLVLSWGCGMGNPNRLNGRGNDQMTFLWICSICMSVCGHVIAEVGRFYARNVYDKTDTSKYERDSVGLPLLY